MYIYGSTHVDCVPMTKGVASCWTMKAHSSAQLHAPLWETLVGMAINRLAESGICSCTCVYTVHVHNVHVQLTNQATQTLRQRFHCRIFGLTFDLHY